MRGRKSSAASSAAIPFPGYADLSEIATSPFATVYRATELGTGRPVALKVLRLADQSPHMAEVFDKELGALALLSNHPNVTTLYRTFFSPEGRPVLVLELCRESLAQRVRQSGPLAALEVVRVGVKIAGALETAHRSGLLHRDVKPQNILVSQFGEPMLADFGVAALQAAAQSTEGVFGFTTLHAPPEVLEGQPLSPSADVYGLASSMYQLALGRGPFAAYDGEAPASVILRILRDPAPRPPVAAVPVALADLLEAALAKDPRMRPQSADAFAEALRQLEANAGWPQTSYVVWGAGPTGPSPASLSSAEPSPASLSPGGPSPASPSPSAAPEEPSAAPLPALPARLPAEPWRPTATTTLEPPPAAPRSDEQPPPPGTRAVIAPPAARRNVVPPATLAPVFTPDPPSPPGHWRDLSPHPAAGTEPIVGVEPAGPGTRYGGFSLAPVPSPRRRLLGRAWRRGRGRVIALSVLAAVLLVVAAAFLVLVF